MVLSPALQQLPPQALELIRYLDGRDATDLATIQAQMDISERVARKTIRRLVTRYFVEMVAPDVYALSEKGRQGAAELRAEQPDSSPPSSPLLAETAGDLPVSLPAAERSAPPAAVPAPEPPAEPAAPAATSDDASPNHTQRRRLSVMIAQELVLESRTLMLAGFDAARNDQPPLPEPVELLLRVVAPGCDVEPAEDRIELIGRKPAGPVQFRIRPHQPNPVRVQVEVYHQSAPDQRKRVGGIYFSRPVSPFPTPQSAELKALGAEVTLELND